eukprot:12408994-Karenia_brevis.AAC.1
MLLLAADYISVGLDETAKREVRSEGPRVCELGDIEHLSEKQPAESLRGGGFPGQGLSVLSADRLSLVDPRSHFFFALIDFHEKLTKAFPAFIRRRFFEGVDSALSSDVDKVNETLRVKPFQ